MAGRMEVRLKKFASQQHPSPPLNRKATIDSIVPILLTNRGMVRLRRTFFDLEGTSASGTRHQIVTLRSSGGVPAPVARCDVLGSYALF
jgi:hypothetical protein